MQAACKLQLHRAHRSEANCKAPGKEQHSHNPEEHKSTLPVSLSGADSHPQLPLSLPAAEAALHGAVPEHQPRRAGRRAAGRAAAPGAGRRAGPQNGTGRIVILPRVASVVSGAIAAVRTSRACRGASFEIATLRSAAAAAAAQLQWLSWRDPRRI